MSVYSSCGTAFREVAVDEDCFVDAVEDDAVEDELRKLTFGFHLRHLSESSDGVVEVLRHHLFLNYSSDGVVVVANTEQLLRIIESIPSKKAEPFKQWLAQVGRERIEEIIDPELTIERALDTYRKKGYPPEWINQRLQTIRARKELTDEWQAHGVQKGQEYAILTDEITKAWSGHTTRSYKNLKGLTKENLRDNMSTLELALNMLAEATTTELTRAQNPQGLAENQKVAHEGGSIAGNARKQIEAQTGRPVVSTQNALTLNALVVNAIEAVAEEKNDGADQ